MHVKVIRSEESFRFYMTLCTSTAVTAHHWIICPSKFSLNDAAAATQTYLVLTVGPLLTKSRIDRMGFRSTFTESI